MLKGQQVLRSRRLVPNPAQVSAGSSWITDAIAYVTGLEGFFSLLVNLVGASSVNTLNLLCSNDNTNFVVPYNTVPLLSGVGPGVYFLRLDIPVCVAFELKLDVTVNPCTPVFDLAMA